MSESWKVKNRRWHANIGMALAVTLGLIALSCPFIAHKGGGQIGEILKNIHYGKFLSDEWRWIWIDGQGLGLAFLVFSGWMMHRKAVKRATNVAGDDPTSAGSSITFVGLGDRAILDAGAALFEAQGLRCFRCEAAAFSKLNLEQERWMVFTAGEGVDCGNAVTTVLAALGQAAPGKARRLEFTIDPTLDADLAARLAAAMERAGARRVSTMGMPASLAAATRPEKRPFSNPIAKPRPASGAAGWSLIEMLVVLAVMLTVAATLGSGMQWLARKQKARDAAAAFQSMVRDASQLARREMTPVRLVFLGPDNEAALKNAGITEELGKSDYGCRMLMFEVPGRNLPLQALLSPAGEDDAVPPVPLARLPRFPSMTGGWLPAPEHKAWLKWEDTLIGGNLTNDFKNAGFAAASKVYQLQPDSLWAATRSNGFDPFSIYPPDFARSPYHFHATIQTSDLPNDETIELEGSGSLSASEVFGGQALPHWSRTTGDRVELPAIDFLPDGGLACRDRMDALEFQFGQLGTDSRWTVKVRTEDAETWIE